MKTFSADRLQKQYYNDGQNQCAAFANALTVAWLTPCELNSAALYEVPGQPYGVVKELARDRERRRSQRRWLPLRRQVVLIASPDSKALVDCLVLGISGLSSRYRA